jgi:hypothetical protein
MVVRRIAPDVFASSLLLTFAIENDASTLQFCGSR